MTTWLGEIKCPQCGHWQIPMTYCPSCGYNWQRIDEALLAEFAAWDQLSDEALLNVEQQASAQVRV